MSCIASDADIEYVQLLASYLALAHGWKYLMAAATAASRFSRAAAADVCKCRVEYEAKPRKDTTKRSTHGLSLK